MLSCDKFENKKPSRFLTNSDSVKLGVLGSPLTVSLVLRLGSRIICWTAASDKGGNIRSFSRAGPRRSTAEGAADAICSPASPGIHQWRRRCRRWKVYNPMTTGRSIESTLSGDSERMGEYQVRGSAFSFGDRRSRWKGRVL